MTKPFTLALCLLLLLALTVPACAAVTLAPLSAADADAFTRQLRLSSWTDDGGDYTIHCFDVSADSVIALGFQAERDQRSMIGLYNADGTFLRGYTLSATGTYYVEWLDTNALRIYLAGSKKAVTLTPDGTLSDASAYIDDQMTSAQFLRLGAAERSVNGVRFCLDKDLDMMTMFSSGYNRLYRVDADGSRRMLRNKPYADAVSTVFLVAAALFFVVAAVQKKRK